MSEFSTTLEKFYSIQNRRFGILTHNQVNRVRIGKVDFYRVRAFGAFGKVLGAGRTWGLGFHQDLRKAEISAMGEFLERYSAGLFHKKNRYLRASEKKLVSEGVPYVSIDKFWNFSIDKEISDFPFQKPQKSTEINWTRCVDLNGNEVLIPSQYADYRPFKETNTPLYNFETSNGLALFSDYEGAAYRALCEVIERDTVMCWWWSRSIPPVVSNQFLVNSNKLIDEKRVKVVLLKNQFDIPVALASQRGDNNFHEPALSLGASSNLDPDACVDRAYMEMSSGYTSWRENYSIWSNTRMDENPDKSIKDFMDIGNFYARELSISAFLLNFLGHERKEQLTCEFPQQSDQLLACKNDGERLKILVSLIESHGYKVYFLDMTSSDVAAIGMRVVRAIVPGLLPINMSHTTRPSSPTRLLEFCKKLNLDHFKSKSDINNLPQPIP